MKVLISDKIQEEGIKILEDAGINVVKNYKISQDELIQEIKNYDAIVIRSRTQITEEVLENAGNLKVIGRAGKGLDNVNRKKAKEKGVEVLNTPEAPAISVAELAIGLMLSLYRHIAKANEAMHQGKWLKGEYLGTILKGKKLGLIGFGNIGQAVAMRADAFEMEIGAYDVDENVKEVARNKGYHVYSSVDELVKDANVISLHVPAMIETENTINQERIDLMNEDTIIINTARGKLIDEHALAKALKEKKILGAGLDVYREEPIENEELMAITDNLILTPHIGSQTKETQVEASIMIAEKIVEFLGKKM